MKAIFLACLFPVLLCGCATTLGVALAADAKLKCLTEPDAGSVPDRTRGEFPFRILYVNQGVRGSIDDTRICQFQRRQCFGGGAWDNVWSDAYASGSKHLVIPPGADGRRYIVRLQNSCELLMRGYDLPTTASVYLAEGTEPSLKAGKIILGITGEDGPETVRVEKRDDP